MQNEVRTFESSMCMKRLINSENSENSENKLLAVQVRLIYHILQGNSRGKGCLAPFFGLSVCLILANLLSDNGLYLNIF